MSTVVNKYFPFLFAAVLFWYQKTYVVSAGEPQATVGKIRASADIAFQKGEIDQSLKLWEEVRVNNALSRCAQITLAFRSWSLFLVVSSRRQM